MGMYTELVLKCRTKEDTPKEVKEVLDFLFNGEKIPETLPNHPFFSLPRWRAIGSCSSYYHHPQSVNHISKNSNWKEWYIFSRSDLKNYDGEIEAFIDWLTPYLEAYNKTCIGWKWYEEDSEPTLLFVGE
jgi:hypothetical protein